MVFKKCIAPSPGVPLQGTPINTMCTYVASRRRLLLKCGCATDGFFSLTAQEIKAYFMSIYLLGKVRSD